MNATMYRKNAATGAEYAAPRQPEPAAAPQERPVAELDQPVDCDWSARVEAEVPRVAEPENMIGNPIRKNATNPSPKIGEVRAEHVRRVLRPTEAGLDEREAGLHEDHEARRR